MFSNEDAKKKVLVKILRRDGETLVGNLLLPVNADLVRCMNNDAKYLEFRDFAGKTRLISKASIVELESEILKQKPQLRSATIEPNADPYAVLGLKQDSTWAEVRTAYLKLTKQYHPDQFSSVPLPDEVVTYMNGIFSQTSTAYNLIKAMQAKDEAA